MASTLHDREALNRLIADYVPPLAQLGAERLAPTGAGAAQPLIVFVVTGGTEQSILELWEDRTETAPGEPLILLAHPGHNSLPASLEALARLHQLGAAGRIIYLQGPDDQNGLELLREAIADLQVRRALREVRIGLVGPPSDWLVASSPNPGVVREVWGPHVVPIDLDAVYEQFRSVADPAPMAAELIDHAEAMLEASPAEVDEAARFAAALRSVVADQHLDAVTVRCFDVIEALGTSGCMALSRLNDDGVIAGCEGDLVSTVGMIWVDRLLGILPWMANPARLDVEANTVWLAHCTVPRSLVESFSIRSHFESGMGVGIEGRFPGGPVTLLRIGGTAMDRLWAAEGEILQTGSDPSLCRTQIEVRLGGEKVSDLLEAPLGNHLIVVTGHHRKRLEHWQSTMVPEHLTLASAPQP
jgi:L-fucose isomerase-like protein